MNPDCEALIFERWVEGDKVRDLAREFSVSNDAVLRAIDKFAVIIDGDFKRRLMTREVERLEAMHSKFYKLATENGDCAAGSLAVKISERRARLLGLDAPIAMDMTQIAGPRENSTERIRAVLDNLVRQRPGGAAPALSNGGGSAGAGPETLGTSA